MKEYQYTLIDFSHYFGDVWSALSVDEWKTRPVLVAETGINPRTLSACISQMRRAGYPIVSKRTSGLKIARTAEEIEANIVWLEDTAEAYLATIEDLKRIRKEKFE